MLGRTDELGRRDGYTACTYERNGRPASHPTTPKSASVSSEVHQLRIPPKKEFPPPHMISKSRSAAWLQGYELMSL